MRFAALVLAGLATAAPAAAQTFAEAVRSNFVLATDLCAQVMLYQQSPATAFGNAGFVYRPVDRGTNDYGVVLGLDHYFEAPADTVKAEVDNPGDGFIGLCLVLTRHMAEPEAAALVGGLLSQRYPMTQARSPNEWSIRQRDLPLIVTVRTISSNHRYEAPGTIQVSMSFPG